MTIDGGGITINRYGIFGSSKTLPFDAIATVTMSRLGSFGRWRLVGWGPGGGNRNWYGWDRTRRAKEAAYSFDTGQLWRPTVTPDDPELFLAALPATLEVR